MRAQHFLLKDSERGQKLSTKEILAGTTNPSKQLFFQHLFHGTQCRILTPAQLGIHEEPEETGRTPVENAMEKAMFYGCYAENVITTDSGMRWDELPADDSRQPGLHLRTPYGIRLSDEEMLAYYSGLIRGIGGKVTAYYLDAFAMKSGGRYLPFEPEREELLKTAFVMRAQPVEARMPGWPLDSLSFDQAGISFLDPARGRNMQDQWGYMPRLRRTVLAVFGLKDEVG